MKLEELNLRIKKTKSIVLAVTIILMVAMVGAMILVPFTKDYNIPGAILLVLAFILLILRIIYLNKLNRYEDMLREIIQKDRDTVEESVPKE